MGRQQPVDYEKGGEQPMSGVKVSPNDGRTAGDVSSLRPTGRVPLAAVQRQPRPLTATAADGARHGVRSQQRGGGSQDAFVAPAPSNRGNKVEMHYIALRPRLCVAFALAFAALGVFASVASASYESEYENGVALGTQAYVYGYPLVDTNRVFETNTSTNVCDERGDGPVNRFCAGPKLAEVKDHT